MQFNDWTVLEDSGKKRMCRCKCGTERLVYFRDIQFEKSKGCGCEARKALAARSRIYNRVHGKTDSREMRSWVDMVRRCHNPKRKDYKNYGARGISVCDEWRYSFQTFLKDMGERPPNFTLDRIDNNGPYCPQNCRWVDRKMQERNKRTNARYTFNGVEMTVVEASEVYKINVYSLYNRLGVLGWSPDRAVNEPIKTKHGQSAT